MTNRNLSFLAHDSIYEERAMLSPARPSVPLSICHKGVSYKNGYDYEIFTIR